MIERFTSENLDDYYKKLVKKDKQFSSIIEAYGPPPLWIRPNSFETLVLTILEQQVSLASAYAAYSKLKARINITPENLLGLEDGELRNCYLSRQKIIYTRELAKAIISKEIALEEMTSQPDEVVRTKLKKIKGIGDWTVDIYLIHALGRTDVFPVGDLALVNSIRMNLQKPQASKEDLVVLSHKWKPYRSIATLLFWHYYIRVKNIKLLH
jgi:DNA-3-methyladenine glycosylase II